MNGKVISFKFCFTNLDRGTVRSYLKALSLTEFANPYKAAELGYLDAVILPEETRQRLYEYLVVLKNKKLELPKRKHGNIQL